MESELPIRQPAAAASDTPHILPEWRRNFATFWDVFLIAAFGAGLFDAARPDGLLNGRGFWLMLLALAFLTAHRWLWAPVRRVSGVWPPLYRDLLLVLVVELVLVIAMLPASSWFAWPLLAMMGQVAAALPTARWRIPFAAILLVLAGPIGLYDALGARQWGLSAGLAAAAAWLLAIFLYIRLHFDEREVRERLERDLAAARAEIERAGPLQARIDDLHTREQSLAELRDSLQHTLAFLNIRLEAVRGQLNDEPATGVAELDELRQVVQQRLAEIARWPAPAELPPDAPTPAEPAPAAELAAAESPAPTAEMPAADPAPPREASLEGVASTPAETAQAAAAPDDAPLAENGAAAPAPDIAGDPPKEPASAPPTSTI